MSTKLTQAYALFDQYNRQSPEQIRVGDQDYPAAYYYALALHNWILKLSPEASEALLLASRCQHIGRWEIARNSYPEGRVGYLKWRSDLGKYHAQKAAEILRSIAYDDASIQRVKDIVQKKRLKTDPEVQVMEDALCLVFLENQFLALIEKHPEEKIIDIVRKTWAKMSEKGQDFALTISYSTQEADMLKKALLEEEE